MKKILEYSLFDMLKDPENEKFLDKVKKENRDLYPQFVNILKRKGLEVAMKEYEEYKLNNLLDEEVYEKWYKEYEFKNTTGKYNL